MKNRFDKNIFFVFLFLIGVLLFASFSLAQNYTNQTNQTNRTIIINNTNQTNQIIINNTNQTNQTNRTSIIYIQNFLMRLTNFTNQTNRTNNYTFPINFTMNFSNHSNVNVSINRTINNSNYSNYSIHSIEETLKDKKFAVVNSVEVSADGNRIIYKVSGKKKGKFLKIIPVSYRTTIKIDAGSGQIISENKKSFIGYLIREV